MFTRYTCSAVGRWTCCLFVAISLAMLAGCGDDGGPAPVVSLSLDVDSAAVEICGTLSIAAGVANGNPAMVAWYVNDVLGGSPSTGTISQTNPATFAAPEAVPDEAAVMVRAVSEEDTTKFDSCRVTVRFTTLHVNAAAGDDATGTGCITKSFKSITRALQAAASGMTVLAAPGIYDAANGEDYPVTIPDGVALIGENWETTILRSNLYRLINISGSHCVVRKFTLAQDETLPKAWNIVIMVNAPAESTVLDSLRMFDAAVNSNVRVNSSTATTITNCRFVVESGEHDGRGYEITFANVGVVIRSCVVSGFGNGIFLNGSGDAVIEGCTLENNYYGVSMCCYNNAESNPNPDLGGDPARGSLGGNIIRNNIYYGIHNPTTNSIYAKYNTWNANPPVVGASYGSDIYNEGTGTVIW